MKNRPRYLLPLLSALAVALLLTLPFGVGKWEEVQLKEEGVFLPVETGLPQQAQEFPYAVALYRQRQQYGFEDERCAERFTLELQMPLKGDEALDDSFVAVLQQKELPQQGWEPVNLPVQYMRVMQAWYAEELRLYISLCGVPGNSLLECFIVSVMPDEMAAFTSGTDENKMMQLEEDGQETFNFLMQNIPMSATTPGRALEQISGLSQLALRPNGAYISGAFFSQVKPQGGDLLYWVSAETGQPQVACAMKNCTHKDEGCAAFLSEIVTGFYDLGDYLFVVETQDSDRQTGYILDPLSGRRRKAIPEQGETEGLLGVRCVTDRAAAVAGRMLWLCRPGKLWRLDTYTGEAVCVQDLNAVLCALYPESEAGRFAFACEILGGWENTLVICAQRTRPSEKWRAKYGYLNSQQLYLFTLELDSGKATATAVQWQGFEQDYSLMVNRDIAWVVERETDTLHQYNLRTGEQQILAQEMGLTQYAALNVVKSFVVAQQPVWCATTQKDVENTYRWEDTRFTWNAQTGVTEITAQALRKGEARAVTVAAAEELIWAQDSTVIKNVPQTYNGQVYYQDTEIYYWRLQPAEDFVRNKTSGCVVSWPQK